MSLPQPKDKVEKKDQTAETKRPVRHAKPRPNADFEETVKRVMAKTSVARAILAK